MQLYYVSPDNEQLFWSKDL